MADGIIKQIKTKLGKIYDLQDARVDNLADDNIKSDKIDTLYNDIFNS